jgi:hypothetical protein
VCKIEILEFNIEIMGTVERPAGDGRAARG